MPQFSRFVRLTSATPVAGQTKSFDVNADQINFIEATDAGTRVHLRCTAPNLAGDGVIGPGEDHIVSETPDQLYQQMGLHPVTLQPTDPGGSPS